MSTDVERIAGTIGPGCFALAEEVPMLRRERWKKLHGLWQQERLPVAVVDVRIHGTTRAEIDRFRQQRRKLLPSN